MAENPQNNVKQEYTTAVKELELVNNEKTKGAQIRSKCLHIDCNEYNTKYF